ncbi:MAG: hypothetical protein AB1689_26745 [Thermodesulfobacteriota bacterium]
MADSPTSSAEKQGSSHVAAIIGWGGLAVATVIFIYFIFIQLGVGWEGREQEALDLVRQYKAPGMQYNLADQTIALGNAVREKGGYLGEFSWSAKHDEGPVYRVELTWKEGSSNHRASWKVNLEDKSVTPGDVEAQKFMKPVGGS